jgi:hypothetical protein
MVGWLSAATEMVFWEFEARPTRPIMRDISTFTDPLLARQPVGGTDAARYNRTRMSGHLREVINPHFQ